VNFGFVDEIAERVELHMTELDELGGCPAPVNSSLGYCGWSRRASPARGHPPDQRVHAGDATIS
jgi:hypothetical protein